MQTAVQLLKQDLDAEIKLGTKMIVNWDMYLEMEKQQIIHAFDEGQEYEYQYHINGAPKFDSETYFAETYGSKIGNSLEWNGEVTQGSKGNDNTQKKALQFLADQAQALDMGYENFKQFSLYEHKETITSADTIPTAPQTEISDEEIEKAMLDRSGMWDDPLCFEIGWKDAIKWYREQLKQRK